MKTQNKQIVGWAVCYVPTKEAQIFAGIKTETIAAFKSQDDAIKCKDAENIGGIIDELHIGYRVYPMHWIPSGVVLR